MRQLVAIITLISFALVSLATLTHGTGMAVDDVTGAAAQSVMAGDGGHGMGHDTARPAADSHCTDNSTCNDKAGLCAAYCAKLTSFALGDRYRPPVAEVFVSGWQNNASSRLKGRVPSLQERPPKSLLT